MAPPTLDTLRAALDRLRRELAEDPLDIGAMVAFAHVSAALAVLNAPRRAGGVHEIDQQEPRSVRLAPRTVRADPLSLLARP